jgi:hypothetical protein
MTAEDLPDQVRATVFGREVVADVVDRIWRPAYNGGDEYLRIAVDAGPYADNEDATYRVPVAQADAVL